MSTLALIESPIYRIFSESDPWVEIVFLGGDDARLGGDGRALGG